MFDNARAWQPEEESFLRQNYKTMQYKDIAVRLGRTRRSVGNMVQRLNLKKRPVTKRGNYSREYTLCWYCARCGNDNLGCPKSIENQPVPGWEATKKMLYKGLPNEVVSYAVKKCPLFLEERRETNG